MRFITQAEVDDIRSLKTMEGATDIQCVNALLRYHKTEVLVLSPNELQVLNHALREFEPEYDEQACATSLHTQIRKLLGVSGAVDIGVAKKNTTSNNLVLGQSVAQLLEQAPAGHVARMRGVFRAIEDGRWVDAAFSLKNAAEEAMQDHREFALAAALLCTYCEQRAKARA